MGKRYVRGQFPKYSHLLPTMVPATNLVCQGVGIFHEFKQAKAWPSLKVVMTLYLLLDWWSIAKPFLRIKHQDFLRQVNLRLDGRKNVMIKFQSTRGASNFYGQILVKSCLCPTFSMNCLVLFLFLFCVRSWGRCYGWITKPKKSILLPNSIENHLTWWGNHQTGYSYIATLIFWWMVVISFLKGTDESRYSIKNGPSTICGRQPLKKWSKQTISLQIRLSSTNFTWSF